MASNLPYETLGNYFRLFPDGREKYFLEVSTYDIGHHVIMTNSLEGLKKIICSLHHKLGENFKLHDLYLGKVVNPPHTILKQLHKNYQERQAECEHDRVGDLILAYIHQTGHVPDNVELCPAFLPGSSIYEHGFDEYDGSKCQSCQAMVIIRINELNFLDRHNWISHAPLEFKTPDYIPKISQDKFATQTFVIGSDLGHHRPGTVIQTYSEVSQKYPWTLVGLFEGNKILIPDILSNALEEITKSELAKRLEEAKDWKDESLQILVKKLKQLEDSKKYPLRFDYDLLK